MAGGWARWEGEEGEGAKGTGQIAFAAGFLILCILTTVVVISCNVIQSPSDYLVSFL